MVKGDQPSSGLVRSCLLRTPEIPGVSARPSHLQPPSWERWRQNWLRSRGAHGDLGSPYPPEACRARG